MSSGGWIRKDDYGGEKHQKIYNEMLTGILHGYTSYLSYGHWIKCHQIICEVLPFRSWTWYFVYNHFSIKQGRIIQTLLLWQGNKVKIFARIMHCDWLPAPEWETYFTMLPTRKTHLNSSKAKIPINQETTIPPYKHHISCFPGSIVVSLSK